MAAMPAVLAVQLVPGLVKGADARQVEFNPPAGGKIRLSLELPGLSTPGAFRVALSLVGADGRPEPVWTGPPVQSEPEGTSQEVRVDLDSASLPSGDYIGQVLDAGGGVRESYSFRVNSLRPGVK
jgi:hypothetical protein